MTRKLLVLLVAASVAVIAGCGGRDRLVGTWTGQVKQAPKARGLEAMAQGLIGALAGEVTIEFNKEGKYKASVALGGGAKGDYSLSGDTVTLTPDDGRSSPIKLTLEGDSLRLKKDFESDPDLVLTHKSTSEP